MGSRVRRPILWAFSLWLGSIAACSETPTGPGSGNVRTFAFDFRQGPQGWLVGAPEFYAPGVISDYRPLVGALSPQGSAFFARIYFSDLGPVGLVYFKRQVSGLSPSTAYTVRFSGEIASNTPIGCGGFGGTPEQTAVVVGATTPEPISWRAANGDLMYNFKLAGPSTPSPDGVYLGDVGTSTLCPNFSVWQLKTLETTATIKVTSDTSGSVWLHQATGTAYNDYITLYFTRFSATFTPEPVGT